MRTLRTAFHDLPGPDMVDPAVVRTLDVSFLCRQLFAGPLYSDRGYAPNLYLRSYAGSRGGRLWEFRFKDGQRFADGRPLRAAHWRASLARALVRGAGVHFNPRRDLVGAEESSDGDCAGLRLRGDTVLLEFKEPVKDPFAAAGAVESAILPIDEPRRRAPDPLREPAAGAYRAEAWDGSGLTLSRNAHFPAHHAVQTIERVRIEKLSGAEQAERLLRGELDVAFPMRVAPERLDPLRGRFQRFCFFGQTVFLSFRRREGPAGAWLKDRARRGELARLLHALQPPCPLPRTRSVLAGPGLGRLAVRSQPYAGDPRARGDGLPPLRLAAIDSRVARRTAEGLAERGLRLEVVWVPQFNALFEPPALDTDAFIGWNDFCSPDPYSSLYNALNPDRPLFPDPGGAYRRLLLRAQSAGSRKGKGAILRALHADILRDALVIPFAEEWTEFFASRDVDLSAVTGFSLWRMRWARP